MSYSATDWIRQHAVFSPDKTAMIDLYSDRRWTYGEYHERVGKVAGYLKSLGIEPGDRVAFLALNSSDIIDLIFGCWRIGAIVLAVNFRLAPAEVTFILNNAEAKAILLDDVFGALKPALDGKTTVEHWISTDCMGEDNMFENGVAAAEPIFEMHPQSLDDQCLLMYSSGTTGTPKGVIITHGMMYFTPSAAMRIGITNTDAVALSNMPLFHIGGLNVTAMPTFWIGGTSVIMRLFEPTATLNAIGNADLGITTLFMVPAAYNALRAHPDVAKTDFSRIKVACAGAETVPTELVHWYLERGITIQEGYGMTETAAAGCFLTKDNIPDRIGSAGRSLLHSRIKIVDSTGEECPPNTPGEIWMKGASVTPGYWRRPEANEKSFVDGWFRSGDIARMDEEGYIYIEDRIKDMYISGGENVYPAEIENVLYQLPQIQEVAVIGVPDDKWGEVGCVVAVLHKEADLTLEDVITYCDGNLAKYKWPHHLHVMKELPRTATGKVQKFELRDTVPALL